MGNETNSKHLSHTTPFFPGLPDSPPLPPQHHNLKSPLLKLGHTGLKDRQREKGIVLIPVKGSPQDPLKDSPLFIPQHCKCCTRLFPPSIMSCATQKRGK